MGRYFSHKPHKDGRIIPRTPEEIQESLEQILISCQTNTTSSGYSQ